MSGFWCTSTLKTFFKCAFNCVTRYFFDQLIWYKFANCQSFEIREPQIKLLCYLLLTLGTQPDLQTFQRPWLWSSAFSQATRCIMTCLEWSCWHRSPIYQCPLIFLVLLTVLIIYLPIFFFYPAGFGQTSMNPHPVKVTTNRYVHSIIAL